MCCFGVGMCVSLPDVVSDFVGGGGGGGGIDCIGSGILVSDVAAVVVVIGVAAFAFIAAAVAASQAVGTVPSPEEEYGSARNVRCTHVLRAVLIVSCSRLLLDY